MAFKVKSLVAYIITSEATYFRQCSLSEMNHPIWKICAETLNQLHSEQYLKQRGFIKIESL